MKQIKLSSQELIEIILEWESPTFSASKSQITDCEAKGIVYLWHKYQITQFDGSLIAKSLNHVRKAFRTLEN